MYCLKTYFVSDEPFDFITMMMPSYVFDLYYFRLSRDLRQNGPSLGGPRRRHRGGVSHRQRRHSVLTAEPGRAESSLASARIIHEHMVRLAAFASKTELRKPAKRSSGLSPVERDAQ